MTKKIEEANTEELSCKIADFGMATFFDPESPDLNYFCGTDIYMAPELIKLENSLEILPEGY